MSYAKYIIDTTDGMVMKLSEDSREYENELHGCSLDIESYKGYRRDGVYIKSTQKAFGKFNKDAVDESLTGAYMMNKEWDLILEVLGKNKKTKELAILLELKVRKQCKGVIYKWIK